MVYIKDWPEFQQRSIKLFQSNPSRARYLIKSHAATHSLTLKVTDDTTTLKYRTRSSAILGRLEIFNKAMTYAMAGSKTPLLDANPEPTPAVISAAAGLAAVETEAATGAAAASANGAAPVGAATPAAASDKKKKKKKGKK
ncbi:Signal recognition particle, SRP9 subunit [Kalmanozyma brasiliensis GHG001]|uniref:SRP9 domain-containing protein n=1 Tax=Kalmanozyma brasiliensis (strain GHG001) TaxID=1365824 RepID=V5ESE7_KALBG|nr:Signal recognition particle, SRP9 subunit [Kalmanozyma brasiliensis GHG001]EST05878.1 Signal recognition particle, SRP9 subunit [Kalmanozyma brasiliensis GHG001]